MSAVPLDPVRNDPDSSAGNRVGQGGSPGRSLSRSGSSLAMNAGMVLVLLVLGIAEGWTRDPRFASDAISYLDISRAIPRLDWKMIFNPFWGLGYPALLAAARPFFPATPTGEWNMVHVVNLAILLAAWAAFLFLLRSLPVDPVAGSGQNSSDRRIFTRLASFAVFLALALGMNGVSSVEPDLLVTCVFLFSLGLMLRLVRDPGVGRAVALGFVLGLGYWVKNVGVPLALIVLATAFGALCWRRRREAKVAFRPAAGLTAVALAVFVLVSLPYVVGISRSYGQITLGLSGPLNYAFDVNLLPHWTNWQGGPLPIYGAPVHPTEQVMSRPDVFVFGKPFENTYPPFGNIAYWYQGFHQFFNPRLQAAAILRAGFAFVKILFGQPILYAALIALVLLWGGMKHPTNRRQWLRILGRLWPAYVPAIAAIGLYLLVHVEPRYLSAYFLVLYILPFLALAASGHLPSRRTRNGALAVLAVGVVLNFAVVDRAVFRNVVHHSYFTDDSGWILARYLRTAGLRSGDKVAGVGGPNAYCEWAYLDGLRIVAEMGGAPYDQRNPQRTSPRVLVAQIRQFWVEPGIENQVLAEFHRAGAIAVIAPGKPAGVQAAEWTEVPGAGVWVYRYPGEEPSSSSSGTARQAGEVR